MLLGSILSIEVNQSIVLFLLNNSNYLYACVLNKVLSCLVHVLFTIKIYDSMRLVFLCQIPFIRKSFGRIFFSLHRLLHTLGNLVNNPLVITTKCKMNFYSVIVFI
ncbi:hypothetical protein D3C80_1926560 [compost metagenome]